MYSNYLHIDASWPPTVCVFQREAGLTLTGDSVQVFISVTDWLNKDSEHWLRWLKLQGYKCVTVIYWGKSTAELWTPFVHTTVSKLTLM